ncbi:MAG: SOS response-associated peptidase, partial [Dysgonamonadaceae bacterium]
IQNKTLNARADTIYERRSYKNAIVSQRCVLVVDGFFEWRHAPNQKIPYYIYPKDGTVFYLGCIYNTWTDKETGEMKDTFSIITTEANPMMEFIHNSKKRMPLILSKDDIAAWIDPESATETVNHLMKPYDESQMSAHTISKDAGYAGNNRNYPEIKDVVEYNETPQGDLFD